MEIKVGWEPSADGGVSKGLLTLAGGAMAVAFAANLADVALGFGGGDASAYGSKSAVEWLGVFSLSPFRGLYALGIFNLVYQAALVPVYLALYLLHRRGRGDWALLAFVLFLFSAAIYISGNAALPMGSIAAKYAAAEPGSRAPLIAAAEALLARGEDFTPGAFPGLLFGEISAIVMSFVTLRGMLFGRTIPLIGMASFSLLTTFTLIATFIPSLYSIVFYTIAPLGGILALAWFAAMSVKFVVMANKQKAEAQRA